MATYCFDLFISWWTLGCFYLLAIMNNAGAHNDAQDLCGCRFLFFLRTYMENDSLDDIR